jgi:SAM-dependent methyltransferase
MEDADLLVRPADLAQVRTALASSGFIKKPGTQGDFVKDGVVLDIHSDVWYLAEAELDAFFAAASPIPIGQSSLLLPDPLDHLVLIIAHAAAHHGSAEARWADDCKAVLAAHPERAMPAAAAKRLRSLGLDDAAAWFDKASGLGLFPEDRGTPSALASWEGEHRGHFLRLFRLKGWGPRTRHLIRQAFPPAEVLALRYDLESPTWIALWRFLRPLSLAVKAAVCLPGLAAALLRRSADPRLPPHDAAEAETAFRNLYEDPAEAQPEGPPVWEPWEEALLDGPLMGPGNLLDIGCEAGREAILLSGRGFRVTGVDPSEVMIRSARKACSEAGTAAEFLTADPETFDPGERRFAVIYLTRVLFSLFLGRKRRSRLLGRLRAWLEPGGRLVLAVYERPEKEGLRAELAWRARRLAGLLLKRLPWEAGDTWMQVGPADGPSSMAVFHRFTASEMTAELRSAGFEPEKGPVAGSWVARKIRTGG